MRNPRYVLVALLLTVSGLGTLSPIVWGQEIVTLTTPIAKTSTSICTLDSVLLELKTARIAATLTCNNGDTISKQYDSFSTPTGASLLSSLNVSTNTVGNSLIKKVYARLALDGIVVGTVSGTPQ
jgi:hypothetical protein